LFTGHDLSHLLTSPLVDGDPQTTRKQVNWSTSVRSRDPKRSYSVFLRTNFVPMNLIVLFDGHVFVASRRALWQAIKDPAIPLNDAGTM